MPQMNMVQALNSAMDIMLDRDPRVVVLGEDVGYSVAFSASPTGCSASTASIACWIRRLPKAALSPRRSVWVSTD